jgi:hypothetical protein
MNSRWWSTRILMTGSSVFVSPRISRHGDGPMGWSTRIVSVGSERATELTVIVEKRRPGGNLASAQAGLEDNVDTARYAVDQGASSSEGCAPPAGSHSLGRLRTLAERKGLPEQSLAPVARGRQASRSHGDLGSLGRGCIRAGFRGDWCHRLSLT